MVLPKYEAARCTMNANSRGWEAGALASSDIPFSSQKQCHISRVSRLVLYTTHVSSSHVWTIVFLMCSCSASLISSAPVGFGAYEAGVHSLSLSLVRQCGWRWEGVGVRCCGYGARPLAVGVLGFGMGRSCSLVSDVFHRLTIGGSIPETYASGFCPCTRCLMAAPLVSSPMSDINEGSYLGRDSDRVKEEGAGWVEAMGGRMGQVLSTWDVLCIMCVPLFGNLLKTG